MKSYLQLQPQTWEAERDVRTCRKCGCTDADCSSCINKTGLPCRWVKADLCSACRVPLDVRLLALRLQLLAVTPGTWRATNDIDTCLIVATRWSGELEQVQAVAYDLLPQDARFFELVHDVLPELLAEFDLCRSELEEMLRLESKRVSRPLFA